ncbi:MAG: PQQ-binding-like beta-propeller repeat protein [Candidatus Omnitrophica bacterium]|nr:PQQ-binding-like beta-propeller repeat protein [Candidatus Omnitrophota bacterium]
MTLIALPHSYSVDWEQYNGNDSTRTTPEKIDLSTLKGNQAKVLWKVPVRNGFSSFSTAGDKIFTLVTRKDQDGIERECCVALNANTGEEIWAQFLGFAKYDGGGDSGTETNRGGDGARSTPSNDGERVYVYDSRMNLYCFDIEDGSVKWQKSIEKDYDGREIRWQSAASPLLMDYLCIVAGGGEGQTMLGFDKRNGSLMGAVGDDLMTHATPIRAKIHGIEQAIFFLQSGVTSVDVSDGQILWHFDFPYVTSTAASPVVAGDLVYCSAGYGVGAALHRIKKTDSGFEAEELWRAKNRLFNHWSTPVYKDGYLYGMFSFKDHGTGPLECVRLEDGEVIWSEAGFGPGNVIFTDGGNQLLALSDRGEIVVIDPNPESYKELARVDVLDGKCWSTPILANGKIYARSTTEAVCLDVSEAASE